MELLLLLPSSPLSVDSPSLPAASRVRRLLTTFRIKYKIPQVRPCTVSTQFAHLLHYSRCPSHKGLLSVPPSSFHLDWHFSLWEYPAPKSSLGQLFLIQVSAWWHLLQEAFSILPSALYFLVTVSSTTLTTSWNYLISLLPSLSSALKSKGHEWGPTLQNPQSLKEYLIQFVLEKLLE